MLINVKQLALKEKTCPHLKSLSWCKFHHCRFHVTNLTSLHIVLGKWYVQLALASWHEPAPEHYWNIPFLLHEIIERDKKKFRRKRTLKPHHASDEWNEVKWLKRKWTWKILHFNFRIFSNVYSVLVLEENKIIVGCLLTSQFWNLAYK